MQLVRKSLPALLKEYHFWNSGTMIYIYYLDDLLTVSSLFLSGLMFTFLP